MLFILVATQSLEALKSNIQLLDHQQMKSIEQLLPQLLSLNGLNLFFLNSTSSQANIHTFFCDNVVITYLYANHIFHSCMKHIAINFHFVCDKVTVGQLCVVYVSTNDQLVDALTKPLSHQRLTFLYSKIGVPNETTILLGYIS